MPTSPTSKSALISGAAKDDALGQDGDFTFTINDLLANDPGGAAKLGAGQFFFGDTAEDRLHQDTYLANHGITDNHNGTYTIQDDAIDFNYFVQIGNKGTWSEAHVDVTAPEPVQPTYHTGEALFIENFDGYAREVDYGTWGTVNLSTGIVGGPAAGHAWAVADGNGGWSGVHGEIVQEHLGGGDNNWLDTQNSPGGINITNWFVDPNGDDFLVSFDLGIRDFGTGPMQEVQHNATLDVLIDGQVAKHITYDEVLAAAGNQTGQMAHFDFVVDGGNAGQPSGHQIGFVDTTPQVDGGNYIGFSLDSIHVNDWLLV